MEQVFLVRPFRKAERRKGDLRRMEQERAGQRLLTSREKGKEKSGCNKVSTKNEPLKAILSSFSPPKESYPKRNNGGIL